MFQLHLNLNLNHVIADYLVTKRPHTQINIGHLDVVKKNVKMICHEHHVTCIQLKLKKKRCF